MFEFNSWFLSRSSSWCCRNNWFLSVGLDWFLSGLLLWNSWILSQTANISRIIDREQFSLHIAQNHNSRGISFCVGSEPELLYVFVTALSDGLETRVTHKRRWQKLQSYCEPALGSKLVESLCRWSVRVNSINTLLCTVRCNSPSFRSGISRVRLLWGGCATRFPHPSLPPQDLTQTDVTRQGGACAPAVHPTPGMWGGSAARIFQPRDWVRYPLQVSTSADDCPVCLL